MGNAWHLKSTFDLLRVLLWRVDISAKRPIIPPKTSTSFTIWPLAKPPTAGLHDVLPTDFLSIETKRVFMPLLWAIREASIPACPPPTTIRSYLFSERFTWNYFPTQNDEKTASNISSLVVFEVMLSRKPIDLFISSTTSSKESPNTIKERASFKCFKVFLMATYCRFEVNSVSAGVSLFTRVV